MQAPASHDEITAFLDRYKPFANSLEEEYITVNLHHDDAGGAGSCIRVEDKLNDEVFLTEKDEVKRLLNEGVAWVNTKVPLKDRQRRRREVYATFEEEAKQLAKRHGVVGGKWLYFAKQQTNSIWTQLVLAAAFEGEPLAETGAVTEVKVTSKRNNKSSHAFSICCRDSWDKDAVAKVLDALVVDLGIFPAAYKPDIYSALDIYSNGPTGTRSSLYKPLDLMDRAKLENAVLMWRTEREDYAARVAQEQEAEQRKGK
ncbi:hypothetical protein JCM8547_003415 [Rhodosporidiobolus lusitaniae]